MARVATRRHELPSPPPPALRVIRPPRQRCGGDWTPKSLMSMPFRSPSPHLSKVEDVVGLGTELKVPSGDLGGNDANEALFRRCRPRKHLRTLRLGYVVQSGQHMRITLDDNA